MNKIKKIALVFLMMTIALAVHAKGVKLPAEGSSWTGFDTGRKGKGTVEVVEVSKLSNNDVRIKLNGELFQRKIENYEFKRLYSMPSNSFNSRVTIFSYVFKCSATEQGSISFEVLESHGIIVRFDYQCGHASRLGYGTVTQN